MIVYNENQKEAYEIFKNTCDNSQYVSFDCEMTGINLGTKTDGTKYDTQEFRYYKQREVVSKLDLIQIGFTFYQERTKKIEKEPEKEKDKKEIEEKQFYLERTFLFYLYKNSKLKMINEDLFDSELRAHPAALKFLGDTNFDFNILIKKGINFNKLQNREKIKNALNEKKILLSNGAMFLSKENESLLIEKVIQVSEYIIKGTSKPFEISFDNNRLLIFFLGINFKKLLNIDGFIITKSFEKGKDKTIIITKKENISNNGFNQKYNSFDNFKIIIKNDVNIIYQSRYQLGCFSNEEIVDQLTDEELGFSKFIEYLCSKKIPIIGHNIYYDMMFVFDKLIGDLPPDFYSFKEQIHQYFPIIYDTKYITTKLTQQYKKCNIEKTNLDNVYKTIMKDRFDIYVDFFPDAPNGFCLYNDMERDKLHDAGYDSIITGRCFILLNKALENGFEITNVNKQNLGIASKDLDKEKEEIKIKYGFADKNLFEQYANKTFMSLIENENGIINWNVGKDGQSQEEFNKGDQELINDTFKNVFLVIFKVPEDHSVINIYEISDIFENDDYAISIVKADIYAAFVEFTCDEEDDNKDDDNKKIEKLVENIKNSNSNDINAKWKIEKIYSSKEFYDNYKEIINLKE